MFLMKSAGVKRVVIEGFLLTHFSVSVDGSFSPGRAIVSIVFVSNYVLVRFEFFLKRSYFSSFMFWFSGASSLDVSIRGTDEPSSVSNVRESMLAQSHSHVSCPENSFFK